MTSKRYECTLSPELLQKAVSELNEPSDNVQRLKAIDELRESYNVEKYGQLKRDDDEFLLRFLRSKKFKQKKALAVLQNYHAVKMDFKEVFERVNKPDMLNSIIEKSVLMMLPGVSKSGAAVMLFRQGQLDKDINIYDLMAYSVLSMEKLLENEEIQINGVATIKDLQNFNISMFTRVSPIALGKMSKIWQDAMPLRFKEAHIVNEGTLYDIMLVMIRPFLKRKLLDRTHVHGNKYKNIHKFIDPSVLPPYLEGTGPDLEHLAHILSETFAEQDTARHSQDTPL